MATTSLKREFIEAFESFGDDSGDRYEGLEDRLIDWAKPLMQPSRYKVLFGGRGSGKSVSTADALLIEGTKRRCRVLCSREFQISIKESVHYLLAERIDALGLDAFYLVQHDRIIGKNGTEFIFKGLRHNVNSIKSMQGITHCWIEEAQTISQESWRILIPTIREPNSEIWVTFNPHSRTDVVYQELVEKGRDRSYVRRVNWDENPYFPAVLDEERRAMQSTDPDAYHHIWEGGFWEQSNAQVLYGKWGIDEFEPDEDWDGPYFGADWGFAVDPTVLIRCWIHENTLYVEHESYAVGLELDHTAGRWLADVPGCDRHIIEADSARPESISYMRRYGFPQIRGVSKGKGSVEDGIAHLRSYDRIVIHPRCIHTAEEARLYSYKVDRLSGNILPVLVDAHNHCVDALRYALDAVMRARKAVPKRRQRSMSNW